jgi:hypothetical protein
VQVRDGADGVPPAMKPKVVEALAPSAPLYGALPTVTADPFVLSVPLQTWLMACPPLNVHRTVQPLIADEPAFTVTSPWKPPVQELVVL